MPDKFKSISFHRHWISYLPHFFFASAFLFLALYLTANHEWAIVIIPFAFNGEERAIRIPFLLVVFFVLIIRPIVKLHDSYFEVTGHHLRITRGKFSLWKNVQEFAFEDLLGVEVSQSILGRILNYGDIKVGSKTSSINITMGGIRNPDYYADIVSRRIDASRIDAKPV
jgi:uncharacterized membrane protein YdbT with pleckstrin-like domain